MPLLVLQFSLVHRLARWKHELNIPHQNGYFQELSETFHLVPQTSQRWHVGLERLVSVCRFVPQCDISSDSKMQSDMNSFVKLPLLETGAESVRKPCSSFGVTGIS
jgi:hypothetical protein